VLNTLGTQHLVKLQLSRLVSSSRPCALLQTPLETFHLVPLFVNFNYLAPYSCMTSLYVRFPHNVANFPWDAALAEFDNAKERLGLHSPAVLSPEIQLISVFSTAIPSYAESTLTHVYRNPVFFFARFARVVRSLGSWIWTLRYRSRPPKTAKIRRFTACHFRNFEFRN
jgi:hypothetical protein